MEKMVKQLSVGDKIVVYCYQSLVEAITIERVTATMAFSGKRRLQRSYTENYIKEIGARSLSGNSFRIATEELLQKANRIKGVRHLKNFDFNKLKDEDLENVLRICIIS